MAGAIDPQYVLARRVLLDALDALRDHRNAIVLVGAQAVYLHTGESDLAVAPFTLDADLAIDPQKLKPDPRLAEAMAQAGFSTAANTIGIWKSNRDNVSTDLLVPEAVAGGGRRSADLGVHGDRVARKVKGLEAALVDKSIMRIAALDKNDDRSYEVMVAGPAALLIAKAHKLYERREVVNRRKNKDALDVYRLLQAIETEVLAHTISALCADPRAISSTQEALEYLSELFASPQAQGSQMAASAVEGLDDPDVVANACVALTAGLLESVPAHR